MAIPKQVTVRVGLGVGKGEHFAEALDDGRERLFARSIGDDRAALEALLGEAEVHGVPGW